ncbi:MAG: hypothetical protein Q4A78_00145 [Peptostreptococcaceae bacterium]|nr:hypothetical protein [Peptostreptococcaceae bacterium]
MYKKIGWFTVLIISILSLSACDMETLKNRKDFSREDIIEIYNADNEKILETKEQKILDRFSDLIGMSTEKMDEQNYKDYYQELPEDAKILYRYVITTKRKKTQTQVSKISLYVYENYPYITLTGVPIVTPLTWELSEKELELLRHIDNWKNK